MALSSNIHDNGLNHLVNNATAILVCTSEPTDYADAVSKSIGAFNDSQFTVEAPENRPAGGRRVEFNFTDLGIGTGDDTATHYAVTNGSNELFFTYTLTNSKVINTGDGIVGTNFYFNSPE
jgi:hypothetical protein